MHSSVSPHATLIDLSATCAAQSFDPVIGSRLCPRIDSGGAAACLRGRGVGRPGSTYPTGHLAQQLLFLRALPLDRLALALHEVVMREGNVRSRPRLGEVQDAIELRPR